jgi:hypothetical protein
MSSYNEVPDKAAWLRKELRNRMWYFYGRTDGSFGFPNSREGDLLKMMLKFLDLAEPKSRG